jgi:flavorubredoxin
MKAVDDRIIDITPNVKWIGVLDPDIKTFDIVMETAFGTTYNSYFINARKKTLVEVAKEKFFDTYIRKLEAVTNPAEIEYIILNHTEPDHSGSLKKLLRIAPKATVIGSGNAIRYLEDIVNEPFRSILVREGDTLDLGDRKLRFFSVPNLHWPDSIYTYLEEDKILFSCDSFGAHYCDPGMFSRLTDEYLDSYKYYFDVIMKPYSRFMIKAIEKIKPLGIDYICTGHGPVHRENINSIIALTEKYASEYLSITEDKKKKNIFIAYVSAYGYTKDGAEIIATGIRQSGDYNVEVADIENMDPADLDARLTESNGIIVGSPTINQNTLLQVYRLFALINPLRDRGKLGGAFGSYGWSGEASKIILDNFRNLKLRVFEEPGSFKFSPAGKKEENLLEYGRKYAESFLKGCE